MNRRRLLAGLWRGMAAGALAPAVPLAKASTDASNAKRSITHEASVRISERSIARRFRDALAERPWLEPWQGLDVDALAPRDLEIEGVWPRGLEGTLYRNGPARHEIAGRRNHHWFDGDGMVHAWRIRDGRVRHHARMVATHKYLAERDAGRPLYAGFGTPVENGAPVTSPDSVNVANISVLPRGDEVWALWEAGSPWRLDAETLETIGPKSFSLQTKGLPFSAHPRLGPDGTLWNFGYASYARRLVFWRIDPDGSLGKVTTLPVAQTGMPHDFVVTHRHLVLLLPPLDYEPEGRSPQTFLDAHVWHPERPTRVLVMDLADLQTHFWTELPAQWVFHYGNAFEDADGVIRFDGASARDPAMLWGSLRGLMSGDAKDPDEADARPTLFRIDTRRRTASQAFLAGDGVHSEFPNADPRRATQRHRWITTLTSDASSPAAHGTHTTVSRLDIETGALVGHRHGDDEIPEEHLFVPAPGREDENAGWLLGTTLDWRRGCTWLDVLRADAVADGPVARARLPVLLPPGLHGRFVSSGAA